MNFGVYCPLNLSILVCQIFLFEFSGLVRFLFLFYFYFFRVSFCLTLKGEFRLSSAILALAVLVRHLSLCSDASNHGKYSLRRFDLSQFVRLDSAAMKALNLFPQPSDGLITHFVSAFFSICQFFSYEFIHLFQYI